MKNYKLTLTESEMFLLKATVGYSKEHSITQNFKDMLEAMETKLNQAAKTSEPALIDALRTLQNLIKPNYVECLEASETAIKYNLSFTYAQNKAKMEAYEFAIGLIESAIQEVKEVNQ